MNEKMRAALDDELRRFRGASTSKPETAWLALERAHILSQPHALAHVRVHWMLLCYAWRRRELRELVGQIPRLVLAAPASWLGRAPLGNTGRSNVSMFQPMSIPSDLAAILSAEPDRETLGDDP